MDITAVSSQMAVGNTGTAVGIAVTKMAMSADEKSGAQMVDMIRQMELSVNPNLGANIDVRL